MPVFGVFLFRIFPHSDWIRRDTPYLFVFSINMRKYGPEKLWIRTFFRQWVFFVTVLIIQSNLSVADILYNGRLVIADTFLRNWLNHGQTHIGKPLYTAHFYSVHLLKRTERKRQRQRQRQRQRGRELSLTAETHSEPSQTSKIESFSKRVRTERLVLIRF